MIKDPVADKVVWNEYLEAVVRERGEWSDFYRACREVTGVTIVIPDLRVRVFGIRHHGPGSARSVRQGLEEFSPDVVLIEGPSDADPLVMLAASESMEPPIALLA